MEKSDILKLKTSREIMQTLFTHADLWDEEVNEHLKEVAKAETVKKYGTDEIFVYPPLKK